MLQREHEVWNKDLKEIYKTYETLILEEFAHKLVHALEKRKFMRKLMSMSIYDIKCNRCIGNLAVFKKSYAATISTLTSCLKKYFPSMTEIDIQEFIYTFFPFLFGVYPYTTTIGKQIGAMKPACVSYTQCSVYEIIK